EADLERAFTPGRPVPPKESRPRIMGRGDNEPKSEPLTIPFPPAAARGADAPQGLPGAVKSASSAASSAAGKEKRGADPSSESALSLGPAAAPVAALPPIDLLDRHESKHVAIEESELLE